ncbi:MAG: sulfur carrier protein ThiS [Pseudomonadales bacterium]|jgi:sulfur carrier protein
MSEKILINGQPIPLQNDQSLLSLLEQFGAREPYVVALNETFIPRSSYLEQQVQAGDRIEVLQPIQGG